MTLIHLCGGICAGKSFLTKTLSDRFNTPFVRRVQSWDVVDWYKHHELMDNMGNMNWDQYNFKVHLRAPALEKFILRTQAITLQIVETSGVNTDGDMLAVLRKYKAQTAVLQLPKDEVLKKRIKVRGADYEQAKHFNGNVWKPNITQACVPMSYEVLLTKMEKELRCPVCMAPRDSSKDMCCVPNELGWSE